GGARPGAARTGAGAGGAGLSPGCGPAPPPRPTSSSGGAGARWPTTRPRGTSSSSTSSPSTRWARSSSTSCATAAPSWSRASTARSTYARKCDQSDRRDLDVAGAVADADLDALGRAMGIVDLAPDLGLGTGHDHCLPRRARRRHLNADLLVVLHLHEALDLGDVEHGDLAQRAVAGIAIGLRDGDRNGLAAHR